MATEKTLEWVDGRLIDHQYSLILCACGTPLTQPCDTCEDGYDRLV